MRRFAFAMLIVPLAACVGPQLGADISVGPYGTSVSPSISAGLGGGTFTFSP